MTLPIKIIQGIAVKDYAFQWIMGGCPIHQWASGDRGIDQGLIDYVWQIFNDIREDPTSYEPEDLAGITELLNYLEDNKGAKAEPYVPDYGVNV